MATKPKSSRGGATFRRRQRVSKSFELKGHVLRHHLGVSSTGRDYELLVVGGFTFFLPEELHGDDWEEGTFVSVRGSYAGDRIDRRTNNQVPQFELESITVIPGDLDSDEDDLGVYTAPLNGADSHS